MTDMPVAVAEWGEWAVYYDSRLDEFTLWQTWGQIGSNRGVFRRSELAALADTLNDALFATAEPLNKASTAPGEVSP